MSSSSDEEADGWPKYRDRPEWKDVQPITQDDGEYPVVAIAYTDQCMKYLLLIITLLILRHLFATVNFYRSWRVRLLPRYRSQTREIRKSSPIMYGCVDFECCELHCLALQVTQMPNSSLHDIQSSHKFVCVSQETNFKTFEQWFKERNRLHNWRDWWTSQKLSSLVRLIFSLFEKLIAKFHQFWFQEFGPVCSVELNYCI